MEEFIEYLLKEKIIDYIGEFYKKHLNLQNRENNYINIIKNILKIKNFKNENIKWRKSSFFDLNCDIFGIIYERIRDHKDKKVLGEFYTPPIVVNYILKATGYNQENQIEFKKLIDISCGSGSFIIQATRVLILRFLKLFNRKEISELTVEEAKKIIFYVRDYIHGIDINLIACILSQINIHFVLFEVLKVIRDSEETYCLPLFRIKCANALLLNKKEKFDFVIGNPPYLFIRDISEKIREIIKKQNFETSNGQYDYYQIFIELGINLLKNNGKLGYIIPDSILALSNRGRIRKFINNTTKINEIFYVGSKFEDSIVSNVILILEKEISDFKRENNLIKINLDYNKERFILQKTLKKWKFKFLIHLDDIDSFLIDYLNTNFPKLKDLNKEEGFNITLSRGVELTKTGEIIYCKKCKLFFPVPKNLLCPRCQGKLDKNNIEKIIQDAISHNKIQNCYPFIYSIKRYQIKELKYIHMNKHGINYKNLDIYSNRIIIRQLSQNNLICATYDKNLSLTSQSFYNLKINISPLKEFNHEFLLGLINSKLISYYFIKSFGSYKKLFPRILIEKIKSLPIKIPQSKEEKKIASKIIDKVEILLKNTNIKREEFARIQNDIDRQVFNLYKISDSHKHTICDFFTSL